MSRQSIGLSDELHAYLCRDTLRESDVMRRLREETESHEKANMQIAAEQAQFMSWLAEVIGVRRAIEIGTFTGYSALAIAEVLPDDGKLICCDTSEEWTSIGKRYWAEAGVADKIDLRIAPALETLDALLADGAAETFDFAFIDADKEPYPEYYERCLQLLRVGGVVALDNALNNGKVANPAPDDTVAHVMVRVNALVRDDPRVSMCLPPIGDGILLARKR